MKWMIAGIAAVSAVAALANGYMNFSNNGDKIPAGVTPTNDSGKSPGGLTLSNNGEGTPGYMSFSNDGSKPRGEFYTTPGGCQAPRPPEVEDRRVRGASSLRFLESSYVHQVAASIEAAGGKCTCELRFPSWNAALEDLEKRFAPLSDDESSEWVRDFANLDRSRVTREVNQLCKAQGVY